MAPPGGLPPAVSVHCCTWNVGNKQPTRASMDAWLATARTADVVAVAAQEAHFTVKEYVEHEGDQRRSMSYSASLGRALGKSGGRFVGALGGAVAGLAAGPAAPIAMVAGAAAGFYGAGEAAGEEEARHAWFEAVWQSLGRGEFVEVCRETLLQMRLQVFARKRTVAPLVRSPCDRATAATGLLGVVANKGGIAARVVIGNLSLLFVGCHLAAHEGAEYREHRIGNLREILASATGLGSLGAELGGDGHLVSTHTFLMGDLNFRLHEDSLSSALDEAGAADGATPWERTARIATDGSASQRAALLRVGDELLQCMSTGACLQGFAEAPAAFAPTFKLLKGDEGPGYNAKRIPAWTDRVLCHSLPGVRTDVKVRRYDSVAVPDATSDHAPVFCSFEVATPHSPPSSSPSERIVVRLRNCTAKLTAAASGAVPAADGTFALMIYGIDLDVSHDDALLGVWPCGASDAGALTWSGEVPGMGLRVAGGAAACAPKHLLVSLCWFAAWPPPGSGGVVANARRAAAAAGGKGDFLASTARMLGGAGPACVRVCACLVPLRQACASGGEWASFRATLSRAGTAAGTMKGEVVIGSSP